MMDSHDLVVSPTSRGLGDSFDSHFTGEKAEAHRNQIICPRAELGSRFSDFMPGYSELKVV